MTARNASGERTGKRPTIIDVARQAGVSKSTVSLALRGSPLVRQETKAQVERAMAVLGYVYNRSAATLRGAKAGLVGLVINDLRNPFFTEFATSAQMTFSEHGYATVVANTDEDPALQDDVVGSMIEHGVAAFLISPAYGEGAAFERIARAGLPAMQVLRMADPRTGLFPFSAPDYAKGSKLATRHLIEQGATRIAFVGGLAGRPVTAERMAGYLSAMKAEGLQPFTLPGRPSRAFGRESGGVLARVYPDIEAAVAFNDLTALGMMTAFAELGRPVGKDFKLVGFDDIEECAQSFPQLSSVRCDIAAFGRDTALAILDWLERGVRPPGVHRTPVAVMARASSVGE